MRFWDASALVPLLVNEESTESVSELLREDVEIVRWWGSDPECASAIRRRERDGRLDADDASNALELLDRILAGSVEILPTSGVLSQARRLLAVHDLRAADACHLAAALEWRERSPNRAGFVCLDRRLSVAASREGFGVEPS